MVGRCLFAVWGLISFVAAIGLGGAVTFSLRGEIVVLLAVGVWGVVVQTLALLTGVVCLGFAGALVCRRASIVISHLGESDERKRIQSSWYERLQIPA